MCNEYYANDKLCKCKRIEFNQDYRRRVKAGEPLKKRGRKASRFFTRAFKNRKIREAEARFNLVYCRACEELHPVDDMVKNSKVKSGFQRLCKKCKRGNKLWVCSKCGVSKPKDLFQDASCLSYKTKVRICTDCNTGYLFRNIRGSYKNAFSAEYQFSKYIRGSNYNPYFAKAMGWLLRENDGFIEALNKYDLNQSEHGLLWKWEYMDEELPLILKNQFNNINLYIKTDKWRIAPFNKGTVNIEANGYSFEIAQKEWGNQTIATRRSKMREYNKRRKSDANNKDSRGF